MFKEIFLMCIVTEKLVCVWQATVSLQVQMIVRLSAYLIISILMHHFMRSSWIFLDVTLPKKSMLSWISSLQEIIPAKKQSSSRMPNSRQILKILLIIQVWFILYSNGVSSFEKIFQMRWQNWTKPQRLTVMSVYSKITGACKRKRRRVCMLQVEKSETLDADIQMSINFPHRRREESKGWSLIGNDSHLLYLLI